MESQEKPQLKCCPEFYPEKWDDKIFEWNEKKFVKGKICTFLYMPMNFGNVMRRLNKKITDSGAVMEDWLCLSDHTSKWNMDIYIAVDKNIEGAENTTLSGKYFSKVYEGNFKETGNWCKDYEKVAQSKGLKTKKMYMWYTTCPKCAKKYGKNYVAIISEIE